MKQVGKKTHQEITNKIKIKSITIRERQVTVVNYCAETKAGPRDRVSLSVQFTFIIVTAYNDKTLEPLLRQECKE